MSTSKRVSAVTRTAEDLNEILQPHFDNGESRSLLEWALIHLQDWRAALPGAASYDGDWVSSSAAGSNPPRGFDVKDPTERDRQRADQLIRLLEPYASELHGIVMRSQSRLATDRDRTLSALNMKPDPECQSHRRKADLHEYASYNGGKPTTVSGNLDEAMSLCRPCFEYCRDTGSLPSEQQLRKGGGLKRPA